MANKKVSRRALFTSIMSLILCCAMLMGTTFAWFTDSVTSGLNTINSGNLDVELMAGDKKVDANTKLFDNVELWEPGMVVYENLQVVNAGTLALKYQLSLNFGNENDLYGHKLSEVLKVALIDKVPDGATRETVLADAKAAAGQGLGTLSNFVQEGSLEAGQQGTEQALVIYWDPDTSAVDNLYNANNGKTTSDGKPLHIEFGINLQATQMMNESDSFGTDYDQFSSILPKATVNNTGAKEIPVGPNETMPMDTTFRFLPNESLLDPDLIPDNGDEYLDSEYRYWHADFVVKADKDVPENSMALAGYYSAFCDDFNDGNWVALTNDGLHITAGDEIRLVDAMGQGAISVSYEEICRYGNDGRGFECGAADLTGANYGTTLTVELRLYETEEPSEANGNSNNKETGYYEVVGTYTYTFNNAVSSAEELKAQLAEGKDVTLAADLTLDADDTITVAAGKDVTIDLAGHTISTVSDATGANRNAFDVKGGTLTVKNGTVSIYHDGENMAWNNSTNVFDVTAGGVLNLENATIINQGGSDMAFAVHLNNWGEVTLNAKNTTFKSTYVGIRVFNSGYDENNVTLENCYVEGASNALWVHNYTEADFGTAEKAAAQKALLNFDITDTTLVGNSEKDGPIRLGMTNAVYCDLPILP